MSVTEETLVEALEFFDRARRVGLCGACGVITRDEGGSAPAPFVPLCSLDDSARHLSWRICGRIGCFFFFFFFFLTSVGPICSFGVGGQVECGHVEMERQVWKGSRHAATTYLRRGYVPLCHRKSFMRRRRGFPGVVGDHDMSSLPEFFICLRPGRDHGCRMETGCATRSSIGRVPCSRLPTSPIEVPDGGPHRSTLVLILVVSTRLKSSRSPSGRPVHERL